MPDEVGGSRSCRYSGDNNKWQKDPLKRKEGQKGGKGEVGKKEASRCWLCWSILVRGTEEDAQ